MYSEFRKFLNPRKSRYNPKAAEDYISMKAGPITLTIPTKQITNREPYLGLATTRELLMEIKARGEISALTTGCPMDVCDSMVIKASTLLATLPLSMLNYRTVDS